MIFFLKILYRLSFTSDMFIKTYRALIFIFIITFFISCKKDTGNGKGPVISFSQDPQNIHTDTIITPGQLMTFGIEASKGDFNITEFLIRVGNDSAQVYFDTGVNLEVLKWSGSFLKSFDPHETWEFIVRDRFSKSASIFIDIQADTLFQFNPILTFTNLIIGAQDNSSIGECIDTQTGQNYTLLNAFNNQELIDLVCYYFGEDENVIASPGANIETEVFPENISPIHWPVRNTTRFIKLLMDESTFIAIQNDSTLIANYIEGEGKRKAKNLKSNDIYSFKTQDNKIGIMKINQVSGENSGQISFNLKIQDLN